MYTPQFRFVLLISLFVIFGTFAQVLYSYSFSNQGLDLTRYLSGTLTVAGSTFGGFVFIWVCSKFITFNRLKTTGFEGVYSDEYGTKFVFKHPIQLSKYLPDIITKPDNLPITPLETEIIGFLYGFKNMPMDLNDPKSLSIYEYSMRLWKQSKNIKNTSSAHHIVCLSKYLGLTYTYKQKRYVAPTWQFWVKDKIKYSKHCLFHPGYSSFILSTMPAFYDLDEKTKSTLLTALRFSEDPMHIPTNSSPLIYSIYEISHRAEQRLKKSLNKNQSIEINPSDSDIMQFKQQARDFLQSSIRELNLNPSSPINQADGVYLGMGTILVKIPNLLAKVAKNLTPDLRSEFDLWDITLKQHKAWEYLVEMLKEQNFLEDSLEEQILQKDINAFIIDDFLVQNALLIKVEQKTFRQLREFLDSLPPFSSYAVLEKNENDLIKEVKLKSTKIDEFIKKLYS